jgi:hypothetical protein
MKSSRRRRTKLEIWVHFALTMLSGPFDLTSFATPGPP